VNPHAGQRSRANVTTSLYPTEEKRRRPIKNGQMLGGD